MHELRGLTETLLTRRGRSRSDLYELSVASFAVTAHRALSAGKGGGRVAGRAMGAILCVLVLAKLEEGGWFRRSAAPSPGGTGCRHPQQPPAPSRSGQR